MKRLNLVILLIAGILMSNLVLAQNKLALVVAVGKYPKEGGWGTISSEKDIPLITNALKLQGFTDIKIIQDAEATKDGIVKAINDLTKRAQKGDVVVFHYSGHGQQIMDDNGDEMDGFDEALVPFDAHMRYEKGVYEGEKHLRDDELDSLFIKLRLKLGETGNLLVILDACHSGTATRGIAKARGTFEKMCPAGYNPVTSAAKESGMITKGNASRGANQGIAPMFVLSGASPSQLNYEAFDEEGNSVGSLSYAFNRAMRTSDKNTTYRALFEKIKVDMSVLAPNQQPQAEGSMDVPVFGGNVVEQKAYYIIEKWQDANNIQINGGKIVGIYENSKVGLYPIGTTDPSKSAPFATGKVVSSTNFNAMISLDKDISKENIKNYWVFVTEQSYGDLKVSVKLDIAAENLKKQMEESLKSLAFVQFTEQNPDLIIEYGNKYTRGNNLQVFSAKDMILYNESYSETKGNQIIKDVTELIKAYAQGNFLRNLEMVAENYNVEFEFIPVTVNADGTVKEKLSIDSKRDNNNTIVFKDGDHFKLKITNKGSKPAYYALIDIQPDNVVNLLIPVYDNVRQVRIPNTEFRIMPGESIELDYVFDIFPPTGTEVFKLIASQDPINLEPIVLNKGTGTRGNMNPLEQLLANSYGNTRGSGVSTVPAGSANTYTIVFKIEK